jgi:hypothetical protein
MSGERDKGEDILRAAVVIIHPELASVLVRDGGEAAASIDSPSFMRQEQRSAGDLPKHTNLDSGQSIPAQPR